MYNDQLLDHVLEACESGDLMLQAIIEGKYIEMSDFQLNTLYAELYLMDAVAVKTAGGAHLVHWDTAEDYQ